MEVSSKRWFFQDKKHVFFGGFFGGPTHLWGPLGPPHLQSHAPHGSSCFTRTVLGVKPWTVGPEHPQKKWRSFFVLSLDIQANTSWGSVCFWGPPKSHTIQTPSLRAIWMSRAFLVKQRNITEVVQWLAQFFWKIEGSFHQVDYFFFGREF